MSAFWPWLAVAGAGALHGLNPASGWALAAAWGLHSQERMQALRALAPLAAGHIAWLAALACTAMLGLSMDRVLLPATAAGLVVILVQLRSCGQRRRAASRQSGLALWSFMMSSAHGAGMMLLPALIPLCSANSPLARIALAPMLAALAVHGAAMLVVTAIVAAGACRGVGLISASACLRPRPAS